MSDPATLGPPLGGTSFDLRGITRGSRFLSMLRGRSNCVWIDSWTGRLALRVAHMAALRVFAAWPGPILPRHTKGAPLLSWLVAPLCDATPKALADAINEALQHDSEAGTSPAVVKLMQRVLDVCALDPTHHVPHCPPALLEPARATRILLIDERTSAAHFGATARQRRQSFRTMIEAARAAHPHAEFWLARTANPGSGRWLSTSIGMLPEGTREVNAHHSLCATIRHVDHVYTIAAPEGMHALLAGVPVHVFGTPYYAGWGLTDDHCTLPSRTARPTLAALFDIVFLRFTRYLDPTTHSLGTLESLLDFVALQRAVAKRFEAFPRVAGLRFQWWKRPFATPFLTAGGGSLRWTSDANKVQNGEHAALWGARSAEGLPKDVGHIRIEDGFLHSGGLGSDMIAPCSQVIDTRGLYFDASRPSDLTALLNETSFSEAELSRAAALRERIVELGLTKYNLGRRRPAWRAPAGKEVVLVPGQVADDASIRLGTRAICTADGLLREVRKRRPNACIVYKPHPDVLSGNRSGLVDAAELADIVDTDSDLISLIEAADEVHTLSSLAGFDALLRGKAVFTYGMPFYAGWGLTHDALAPVPWRHRILSLDMLTAGVLLRYPIYWDWSLQLFTTPEAVAIQLAPLAARPLTRVQNDPLRSLRKAARWTRNALRHLLWRWQQALIWRIMHDDRDHG